MALLPNDKQLEKITTKAYDKPRRFLWRQVFTGYPAKGHLTRTGFPPNSRTAYTHQNQMTISRRYTYDEGKKWVCHYSDSINQLLMTNSNSIAMVHPY